jgi:hypothetical protein
MFELDIIPPQLGEDRSPLRFEIDDAVTREIVYLGSI